MQGADQAAVADAVMLAVNQRLAPRFVVKPGASSEQLLEVQGMNLERYAALGRLLEPFGARLQSVDGDRILYRVNGSADQLKRAVVAGQVAGGRRPVTAPAAPVQPVGRWLGPCRGASACTDAAIAFSLVRFSFLI